MPDKIIWWYNVDMAGQERGPKPIDRKDQLGLEFDPTSPKPETSKFSKKPAQDKKEENKPIFQPIPPEEREDDNPRYGKS